MLDRVIVRFKRRKQQGAEPSERIFESGFDLSCRRR